MTPTFIRILLCLPLFAGCALAQTWSETAKLFNPLGAVSDRYGWSVSASGQVAVAGAPYDDLGYPIGFSTGIAFDESDRTLLSTEVTSSQLVRVDLTSGLGSTLGTLPSTMSGLAIDPGTGLAYSVHGNSATLYSIDPTTWTITPVGPLANPLLTAVKGLAFDAAAGTLYGVDVNSDVLAVIDTGTGAGVVVGSLGSVGDVTGLAHDASADLLYGSDEATDQLLRIDPTTGASTVIGPLGHGSVGALTMDPQAGLLYGWNSPNVFGAGVHPGLLLIDQATGAGSPVQLSGFGGDEGSAHVVDLDDGTMVELRASDGETGDQFGHDVALDGGTLVVGAYRDDDLGSDSGSAYVFQQGSSGVWSEVTKLLPSDGAAGDWFGLYVAVSADTVAVAAPRHDSDRRDVGSLYVFEGSAGWAQTQVIRPPSQDLTAFGPCALDGDRLLVGQHGVAPWSTGEGRAWVYERRPSGGSFEPVAVLEALDPEPGSRFGQSVALWGDHAAVSAKGTDCGAGVDCGSVYVFERNASGPGAWGQVARLEEPTAGSHDQIGGDLALEGDTLLVGYSGSDLYGSGAGAVIHFERIGGTWTRQGLVLASDPGAGDWFGVSVSLSGNSFVAGAYGDDGYVVSSGAAFAFER